MTQGPVLCIISRTQKVRDELTLEMDGLRGEFIDLQIVALDMTQLTVFDRSAQLVLIDLEQWVPSDELALTEVRDSGFKGPVIVLTKKLTEAAGAAYAADKIVFLDRSKGGKELLGLARRMMLGSLIAARKHPRHATNEKAQVMIDGNPSVYMCKVVNISKGGALLQFDKPVGLRVGDMLEVKIKLAQLNRLYSVRARVAWVRLPAFGVEFQGEST